MKILTPNEMIREKSENVPESEMKKAIKLANKMIKICKKDKNCVGLSAIQVGIKKNIFVALINGKWKTFINSDIVNTYRGTHLVLEGCMSFPGKQGFVKRYNKIKVNYIDENCEQK